MSRLEELHQLQAEEPNDPFLLYALAMEYRQQAPQKMRAYLEQLRAQHPQYPGTYYHLAKAYIEVGELKAARRTFEEGLPVCRQAKKEKLLQELESAYQEFLFEYEDEY